MNYNYELIFDHSFDQSMLSTYPDSDSSLTNGVQYKVQMILDIFKNNLGLKTFSTFFMHPLGNFKITVNR